MMPSHGFAFIVLVIILIFCAPPALMDYNYRLALRDSRKHTANRLHSHSDGGWIPYHYNML
ncbi:hypothetical protein BIW11_02795 [Tropilaelaps mercedesae]|uniref:Uncharacterized protein n=1 Tax=Tropilaelaps mercedesae TaxID=418985 RepID=A0A1V9XX60_9ACAR|nr:hypothetical protein BIW11_02795 [Tropilaelaps mercedesae]